MKGGLAVLLQLAEALAAGPAAPRRHARVLRGRRGRRRAQRAAPPVRRAARAASRATSRSCSSRPAAGSRPGARARSTCARRSHGARAHSARPWMGVNAIHRAAPVLARVAALRGRRPSTSTASTYRESLQVVRVEGGVANNVVPDRVRRSWSTAGSRRACSLDEARRRRSRRCSTGADEVEVLNASPAAPPNLTNPLVAELDRRSATSPVRPKLGLDRRRALRRARHPGAATSAPAIPSSRTPRASSSTARSLDACLRGARDVRRRRAERRVRAGAAA